MNKTPIITAAIALALGLGLQACSEDGRPSKESLVSVIEEQVEVKGAAADCIADGLLDSDLSDKQLRAVADDDDSGLSEKEITQAGEILVATMSECGAV